MLIFDILFVYVFVLCEINTRIGVDKLGPDVKCVEFDTKFLTQCGSEKHTCDDEIFTERTRAVELCCGVVLII